MPAKTVHQDVHNNKYQASQLKKLPVLWQPQMIRQPKSIVGLTQILIKKMARESALGQVELQMAKTMWKIYYHLTCPRSTAMHSSNSSTHSAPSLRRFM